MAIDPQEARLAFLSQVAQFYASESPSTSAHLMLQRSTYHREAAKRNRSDQPRACQACGTILVPGLTSQTRIEPMQSFSRQSRGNSQRFNKSREAEAARKCIKTTCLVCHRYEKVALEPPKSTKKASLERPVSGSENPASLGNSSPGNPGKLNQSSKQRAKFRKQGGLQTLLLKSKQKSNTQAGSGLDLMDLMKQG